MDQYLATKADISMAHVKTDIVNDNLVKFDAENNKKVGVIDCEVGVKIYNLGDIGSKENKLVNCDMSGKMDLLRE